MARRIRVPRILLFALFLPAALLALPSHQNARSGNAPFKTGERLVYKIEWDPPWYMFFLPSMEAGEAELELAGETQYKNRTALKIVLRARSSGMLARMAGMKVEDEFVLFTNPESFCTIGLSTRIREGKRKRQIDVEYFGETGQLYIREVDEAATPPKVRKDEMKNNIPPCVHDPLSAVYLFRRAPLRVDYSQSMVIANDDKIQEVKVHVEKREQVSLASGKTAAWRVNTTALKGQLFRATGQFRIWVSADERRLPVQFEAKVNLGRVLGKLKSAK